MFEVESTVNRYIAKLNNSQKKSLLSVKTDVPTSWKIEGSEALYRIAGWGEPYFSINANGHVTVSHKGDRGGSLDLADYGQYVEPNVWMLHTIKADAQI